MDELYKLLEYKMNLIGNKQTEKELSEISKDLQMIYTDIKINKGNKEILLENISNANIIDRMDRLIEKVDDEELLNQYRNIDIPMNTKITQNNICEYCGEAMILSYNVDYYICDDCSLNRPIINGRTESIKNIPRSKIGNFNPERHFKTWMDRIFAKENDDELKQSNLSSDTIIKMIRDSLISRSKSIEHLTIDDIRLVLKELDITSLNKNTSLIVKKLTGRAPPSITENQYLHVHSLFILVMEARDNIPNIIKSNRIYYPYYIGKILDVILTDPHQRKILNYIHFHKESTLSYNDMEWEEICKIVKPLQGLYKPTIPSTVRYV